MLCRFLLSQGGAHSSHQYTLFGDRTEQTGQTSVKDIVSPFTVCPQPVLEP